MAGREILDAVLRRTMADGYTAYKLSLDDYGGMEVLVRQQDDGSLMSAYAWTKEASRLPPKWVGIPTNNPELVHLTRSFLVAMHDEILRQIGSEHRLESRRVFSDMTAPSAAQDIVDQLLAEYHSNDDVQPGSKDDPWRQTTSPLKLKAKDFTGKRGGVAGKKAKDAKEDDADEEKEEAKPRFKLKFESRAASLLAEIVR